MPGEGEFIRITNKDIYDGIKIIERKLDQNVNTVGLMERDVSDHAVRIRRLELRFYGILAGLVSAIAVLVALALRGPT